MSIKEKKIYIYIRDISRDTENTCAGMTLSVTLFILFQISIPLSPNVQQFINDVVMLTIQIMIKFFVRR